MVTILKFCFYFKRLVKKVNPDKYVYTGYGIGFDLRSEFALPDGSIGKNFIIFGVDMSSSVHVSNKKKRYLNSWFRANTRII